MPELSEIISQFSSLGIELDDETAAACLDLCVRYSVNEESFVNSWIAFSISSLGGADPNKDNLEDFERKELSSMKTPKRSTTSSRVQIYSANSAKSIVSHVDSFTPPRRIGDAERFSSSKKLTFSPMAFTPDVGSPSEKFNGRKNSGQSVSTCGKSLYEWKSEPRDVEFSEYGSRDPSKWKFFYDPLAAISDYIESRAEMIADDIVKVNKLQEPVAFRNCGLDLSTFRGKVCAYDRVKKSKQLNAIEVQGLMDSDFEIIELDVSDVENFALFPGQVIVFEGSIIGKRIHAKKIYTSAAKPMAPPPTLEKPVTILVAAGPYALSDSLLYEPLDTLIEMVAETKPNILMLIGPLVDAAHTKISSGQISETFSDYYTKLVQRIAEALAGTRTQIAVLASAKDVNSIPVYPTPPAVEQNFKNVTFYPDPSIFSIEGLIVGVTSQDTIFHLGKHELSNCQTNRLGRLGAHTIHQQCFYPLNPPEPEACVDVSMWAKECQLPVTPHVMILPSDMHGFIKEAEGCVLLNPGKMTKGLAGGTYALIEARPVHCDENWSTASHLAAKVVRI